MFMFHRALAGASVAALAFGLADPAIAADAVEAEAPAIIVTALRVSADTVPTLRQAQREIDRTPGGADLVTAEEFSNRYAVSFHETLAFSPGVFAQARYGEEVRLSIRGSGIGRGFHLRGVTLLQDGVPISLSDGSGDFQELDPSTFQHIAVYRGANALRFGSSSLGGAINAVTPSGHTVLSPFAARLEGGSFGTLRTSATAAFSTDAVDGAGTLTASIADGFREQSEHEKLRINGNLGILLSREIETRFYISANRLDQNVPGTLTLQRALERPQDAAPANVAYDHARDVRSLRLQNKTALRLGTNRVELGGFLNFKSLYHPIFQVIDQDSTDWGAFARLEGSTDLAGFGLDYVVGSTARFGRIDAKQFVNVGGQRGGLTAQSLQKARTIDAYGEARLYPVEELALIGGLQFVHGRRELRNELRPAASDARNFTGWAPKLGLLWKPEPQIQVYANFSRSVEIPTFSELVQQPVVGFVPLGPQSAWTIEVGTRGEHGPLAWDVSLYRSRLDGELLQFTLDPDVPASTFNAGRTLHQGIEAGLDLSIAKDVIPGGSDALTLRQVYQFNDFRFDDDPQYGTSRLPAVPKHLYRAELRYSRGGFSIAPSIEWVPNGAWADYRNSTRVPGYAMIGAQASLAVGKRVELFVDARNLADKAAVSDVSAVIAASPASAIYHPIEGRALFGGLKFAL